MVETVGITDSGGVINGYNGTVSSRSLATTIAISNKIFSAVCVPPKNVDLLCTNEHVLDGTSSGSTAVTIGTGSHIYSCCSNVWYLKNNFALDHSGLGIPSTYCVKISPTVPSGYDVFPGASSHCAS